MANWSRYGKLPGRQELDVTNMQEAIYNAFLAGRWEWAGIEPPTLEGFASHVQHLNTTATELERHGSDLYLAFACGRNDRGAVRILEQAYRAELEAHLAQSGFDDVARQDVLQQLLLHLCTGESPRILTYAGRATLSSWLKVATLRFAINMTPKTRAANSDISDLALSRLVIDNGSPEEQFVAETARPLFQNALTQAMAKLSSRDATLLRLFFVEGMSNEGIGKLYGVHRATSARWLSDIRRRILEDVQQTLVNDFGVRTSEFESLAFLIRSQLHLSLRQVLGAA